MFLLFLKNAQTTYMGYSQKPGLNKNHSKMFGELHKPLGTLYLICLRWISLHSCFNAFPRSFTLAFLRFCMLRTISIWIMKECEFQKHNF